MLLIRCPYCEEERAEIEFYHVGEAHIERPDPTKATDKEWAQFLFGRDNPAGIHFERWYHIHGCARYFNAARNTISDKFLLTYKAGEPRPDISRFEGVDK